jgi:hypothetical protein
VTTIIAVQDKDGVKFGADSLTTTSRKYNDPRMVKIVEQGQYIIAGSGLASYCDVAQHIWKPPTPIRADRADMYHFVISRAIPSLKNCLKDNDLNFDFEDDDGFDLLLAVGGEVFYIDQSFSVCLDALGIYAIGSGADYAVGALSAGASMELALEIASKFDPYTSSPFQYVTQDKTNLRQE